MTHEKRPMYLEPSPYEIDGGALIGRDPRDIPAHEWPFLLPDALIGMKAIRAKCLDCSHNAAEVRKCTAHDCPLWPLRMGSQPKGMMAMKGLKGRLKDDPA
jgi:hypothetical protein